MGSVIMVHRFGPFPCEASLAIVALLAAGLKKRNKLSWEKQPAEPRGRDRGLRGRRRAAADLFVRSRCHCGGPPISTHGFTHTHA